MLSVTSLLSLSLPLPLPVPPSFSSSFHSQLASPVFNLFLFRKVRTTLVGGTFINPPFRVLVAISKIRTLACSFPWLWYHNSSLASYTTLPTSRKETTLKKHQRCEPVNSPRLVQQRFFWPSPSNTSNLAQVETSPTLHGNPNNRLRHNFASLTMEPAAATSGEPLPKQTINNYQKSEKEKHLEWWHILIVSPPYIHSACHTN